MKTKIFPKRWLLFAIAASLITLSILLTGCSSGNDNSGISQSTELPGKAVNSVRTDDSSGNDNSGISQNTELPGKAVNSVRTDDGEIYLVLRNGDTIRLWDDVFAAQLTPDEQHIVYLTEDGGLHVTDQKLSYSRLIDQPCRWVDSVRNDGFVYCVWDPHTGKMEDIYRASFSDSKPVKLSGLEDYAVAEQSVSLIYYNDEGIYSLPASAEEAILLGSIEGDTQLKSVSNDGTLAVYEDGGKAYLCVGAERETLKDGQPCMTAFSADEKAVYVCGTKPLQLWIKRPGENTLNLRIGDSGYATVLAKKGQAAFVPAEDWDQLYLNAFISGGEVRETATYALNNDGSTDVLLNDFLSFGPLREDYTLLSRDRTLQWGTLASQGFESKGNIADNVLYPWFPGFANSQFLCYLTEDGRFFVYKPGEKQSLPILEELLPEGEKSSYLNSHTMSSRDGGAMFFLSDGETIQYRDFGTLKKWVYGDSSAMTIAEDALWDSVFIAYPHRGAVLDDSFVFHRLVNATDDTIYIDVCFYDGAKTQTILSHVTECEMWLH